MKINNGLIKDVPYRPSPNHSGLITPRLIVVHYTGDDSLSGALSWLTSRASKVSAHLLVGTYGEVFQMVPFNLMAWHAGRSEWEGESGVNGFSIGIENVGTGKKWPKKQIDRLLEIMEALCKVYEIEAIVGHEDVATPEGRKHDPGPNFPWTQVQVEFPKQTDWMEYEGA